MSDKDNRRKKIYRRKYMDRINSMTLLDDDFFTACFQNNLTCTRLVLEIILGRNDLTILKAQTQYYIDDLKGHSVRLDVFATDSQGIPYNIEVQRKDSGAVPRRARYNSSLIDAQSLSKGQFYDKLPESYVIFITQNDVLQRNLPLYHIDRTIHETDEPFGDGAHIIYVNASYKDSTPLGQLMEDFANTNPKSMHYSELTEATKYFKYDNEGVSYMCDFWEELLQEGREEAEEEAKKKIAQAEAARANAEAARAEAQAQAEAARAEAQAQAEAARAEAQAQAEAARAEAEAARAEARKARAEAALFADIKGNTIKNVLRMIRDGLTPEKIEEYSSLPRAEIEELIALTAH